MPQADSLIVQKFLSRIYKNYMLVKCENYCNVYYCLLNSEIQVTQLYSVYFWFTDVLSLLIIESVDFG